MKKNISLFLIVLIVISLAVVLIPQGAVWGAASPKDVTQQEVTPTPGGAEIATATPPLAGFLPPDPKDVVSFQMLGLQEESLIGPYDSLRLRFSLPITWKLEQGGELVLVITAYVVREDQGNVPLYTGGMIAGSLDVTFNDQLIGSLVLESGQNVVYRIRIPTEALVSKRADGRHELYLFLDAGVDCDFENRRTTVVIEPDSAFILPHSLVSPPVDLTLIPRPIYQSGAFMIDPAIIVVPDIPSAEELQAALTAASALGSMSNGRLPVSLSTESELSREASKTANLIFVGKAASLPSLGAAQLPAPVVEASFSAPGLQSGDGVIQMALSPWEPSKVILVLGGNSDAGVVKAAQAFSSVVFQTAGKPDLAVVAEVRPEDPVTVVPADRSFADLGYPVQTVTGIGANTLFYTFYIPPGQMTYQDAYLELVHSHSDLVNSARSGVVVTLNGLPIGSVRLDEGSHSLGRKRILLPASALLAGENTITIQAELIALDNCSTFTGNSLWFTVFPESSLHIPLEPARVVLSALKQLNAYPYPLLSRPTLGNLAFILPQSNPSAWQAAAQIAYDFGRQANGILYEPVAAYADQVSDRIREDYDLILVGLPSELPILAELQESIPVPFEQGSNFVGDVGSRVIYRLPEGAPVAYLELFPSIWNPNRAILAVLGSESLSIQWAVNALLVSTLRNQLCGNFAVIQDSQVICREIGLVPAAVSQMEEPSSGEPSPGVQEVASASPTPIPALTSSQQENPVAVPDRNWIVPAIGGLAAIIVVVLGIAVFTRRRSKANP